MQIPAIRFPIGSKSLTAALLTTLLAALLAGCAGPPADVDACDSPLTPAILNACVVRPDLLWRGGKPDNRGAAALMAMGVRSVVNLELLHSDIDALRSAGQAASQPITVDYFRIREWEPNVIVAKERRDRHVAQFIAIMRTQPKPLYVHCRSGQNRTGVMVAAYRVIEEGADPEVAIDEMRRYQGVWFSWDADYIRSLQGARLAAMREDVLRQMPLVRREARLECSRGQCLESSDGLTSPLEREHSP